MLLTCLDPAFYFHVVFQVSPALLSWIFPFFIFLPHMVKVVPVHVLCHCLHRENMQGQKMRGSINLHCASVSILWTL